MLQSAVPHKMLLVFARCAIAWSSAVVMMAQDTQPGTDHAPATEPAPSTQPADVATLPRGTTELTIEEIQAQIARIETMQDLAETTKSELLSNYRQAAEQLDLARSWSAKVTEYETRAQEAPELLEGAHAELRAAATQPSGDVLASAPAEATLDDLTQLLSETETSLQVSEDATRQIEARAENRRSRVAALPQLRTEANRRLAEVTAELASPPAGSVEPEVTAARRARLLARRRALEQEVRAYDAETRFFEASSDLLSARRELARLRSGRLREQVGVLRDRVTAARQQEVERQQREAEAELKRTPQAIRVLAETNAELAQELAELEPLIPATTAQVDAIQSQTKKISAEVSRLRQRLNEPVAGKSIGRAMRRLRSELVELRGVDRSMQESLQRLDRTSARIRDLDDQRVELASRETLVAEELERLEELDEVTQPERLEPAVREQLERRYELLTNLERDYRDYRRQLRKLVDATGALLQESKEARAFVEEHVLWARSDAPINTLQFPDNWPALAAATQTIASRLSGDIRRHFLGYAGFTILVLFTWGVRWRIRRDLLQIHERVRDIHSDSYPLTIRALWDTALLAAPWPLALYAIGVRLPTVVAVSEAAEFELAEAFGFGLRTAAMVTLMFMFVQHACRPNGLGEGHFRWGSRATRIIRLHLMWLTPLLVVASFFMSFTELYPDDVLRGSLGRLAFMLAMLAIAIFLAIVLHPRSGILSNWLAKRPDSRAFRLRYVWYGLAVGLHLLVAVMAATGWYYTAIQLARRVSDTIWLIVGLAFVNAFIVRWVFVAQRKLAIERARKKREAARAKAAERDEPPDEGVLLDIDEAGLNLGAVGEQTRSILRSFIGFALILGFWWTWADLLPAVGFIEEVTLWEYTVETSGRAGDGTVELVPEVREVNLGHAIVALIVTAVTIVMARNVPGLLEITLLRRLPMDVGGRFAVTSIARYAIIVVGAVAAFGAVGIGWSQVQWLAAAAAVGLGFGLQEIFANFISGLMILFERPIRIGDAVTVGNVSGTVTRIRIRATTITDWDRKELIIPNKEFITGQVINWSLSDQVLRMTIPVGIAYGSDTRLAAKLLAKVADEESNVLKDPKPMVLFMGFGASSLDFELRVYLPNIDNLLSTRTRLNMAIDDAFREHGIEISFPQHDLHIRSIATPLPLVDARKDAPSSGTRTPTS